VSHNERQDRNNRSRPASLTLPGLIVMDTPQPSSRNIEFPLNQAMAYIIGVPTMVLAPMAYWQYGPALFGPSGLMKLFILTGAGGLVSFALFGGQRRWLMGGVLGLIGGLGAAGAFVFYTTMFHPESMMDKEIALVCLAGAAPSMALLAFLLKRDTKSPAVETGRPANRCNEVKP
jgi:nitrate/nitrite transporter NarK